MTRPHAGTPRGLGCDQSADTRRAHNDTPPTA